MCHWRTEHASKTLASSLNLLKIQHNILDVDALNEPDALAAHVCVHIVAWRSRCVCVRAYRFIEWA